MHACLPGRFVGAAGGHCVGCLLSDGKQSRLLLRATCDAFVMGVEALAIEARCGRGRRVGNAASRHHHDAVHRAGCHAQFAARAQLGDDCVHLLACADDGVDGAGGQTLHAPDAGILVDQREQRRTFDAVHGIERTRFTTKQRRESNDRRRAAGRALVDYCSSGCDRLRVGATPVVAATGALRLRQEGVDVVGGRHGLGALQFQVILIPGVAPASGERRNSPGVSPPAASTIPSETPNFILRGARFATMTVSRPFSAAGSYAERMPANTVRVSEPRSSVSLSSLSAPSTVSALTIFATRRSIFLNSSMESVAPVAAASGEADWAAAVCGLPAAACTGC